MFALAKIGAVHVPVNTRFRTEDLAGVLARSNATTLITHDVWGPVDYLAMARPLAPAAGDPAARTVASARLPHLRRLQAPRKGLLTDRLVGDYYALPALSTGRDAGRDAWWSQCLLSATRRTSWSRRPPKPW